MYIALLLFHLIVCLALIGVVLVQSGKGGGLAGGAFGGSAQTVFGGRGATDFVTRATMVLGGLFFATSLVLALMSSGIGGPPRSILQREGRSQAPARGAPRTPGTATPSAVPSAPSQPAPTPGGTQPAPGGATPPSSGGK